MGLSLTKTPLRVYIIRICSAATAVLFQLSSVATAEEANLTPVADTFINSGMPDNNAGATNWFSVGRDGIGGVRRGLLRFDLSSIPAGSTVTAASLELTVARVPGINPADSTFDLFRLEASWNEGDKSGNNGFTASDGESNWNDRMQGSASWTTPGAADDALDSASASAQVTSARNASYTWNGPGLTEDVQFWVDNSAQNFGWLMRSRAEGTSRSVRGFASRENSANAGTLSITYTPPSPPDMPVSVSITAPNDGETFVSPASVTIRATVSDGTATSVEFLDGNTSLGADSTAPYTLTATLHAGTHSLTVEAADDGGDTTASDPVTIMVTTEVIEDPVAEPITKGDIAIELQPVVDGLVAPLGLAVPDDGSGRMFVYDQAGQVRVVTDANGMLPAPLLDVTDRLVSLGRYDERGLLGLATHPNFGQSPWIYTYTSEPVGPEADFVNVMPEGAMNNHQSVIAEWRIDPNDPNLVDPNSRRELLRIDQPQSNHNGGTLRFGPDGFLYISLGDGGAADDVADGHVEGGNAQSLQRIYGTLLRIDVEGNDSANGQYGIPDDNPFVNEDGLDEIYAYGLRNPYTYSFDTLTGDLYLGDAGQNNIEEVDIIVSGGNYGWNHKEGSFWFDSVTENIGQVVTGPVRPAPDELIDPIAEYDHDEGSVVVAGYVYRGEGVPALQDRFVFGDWGSFAAPSARLFTLDPNSVIEELRIGLVDRPTGFWLRGFGLGADGELYVFGSTVLGPSGDTGEMLKVVTDLPLTFIRDNLVSDLPDLAERIDPNLVGPWGIAADPNSLIWVASNGAGLATAYEPNGAPLDGEVIMPTAAGSMLAAAPTGVVVNTTSDFPVEPNLPAELIFATEDGTIVGFNSAADMLLNADFSATGAVYTGITMGATADSNNLYAANFSAGAVEVFDANFNPVTLDGAFSDPNLPAGYSPFNIRNIGGSLYVTYALQDAATPEPVPGAGNGYVNVFDTSGNLLRRFATEGPLDAPWGIAMAPGGFGGYGGAVLIGNFGDGLINVFDPSTGELLGALEDDSGNIITIDGLRGLEFGKKADSRKLYFTAATTGAESRGLFGTIVSTPPQ